MFKFLSFTGQSGCYAELPLEILAGATTFTIEVKLSTTANITRSSNWTWGTIAGREIANNWQDDFGLCVNGGKLCFWAEPKTGGSFATNNTISNATINDGASHRVAVVSSDGAIDLYCDGCLVAHTDNVNAKIPNTKSILLGYDTNEYSYLQMDLFEARFWSVARSQAEIFAAIDGTEQGLEAWYLPSADGLKDYSGKGRDATLYGSPAYFESNTLALSLVCDTTRTVKNDKKIRESIAVWLPFDTSTTQDLCGNTWTETGSPTIQDGALQLNGASYLQMTGGITLGGQDFTIRGKFLMNSDSGAYCRIFSFYDSPQTTANCINIARQGSSANLYTDCMGSSSSAVAISLNQPHDFEFNYYHETSTVKIFFDGVLSITLSKSIPRTNFPNCFINKSNYPTDGYLVGSIDEFQIYDGVALHTENFTPPTADDYIALALDLYGQIPLTLFVDTKCKICNPPLEWRYVNLGDADDLIIASTILRDLPETKSQTGTAFYQTQRAKCFDIPTTNEIWIKFDLYHYSGTSRFRVYDDKNGSTANGFVLTQNSSTQIALWAWNGSSNEARKTFDGILKANTLQTWLLHMRSGSSNGLMELWCDGQFLGSWTGNVNNGEDFANIYLQTDNANNLFSNVIIANTEIALGEGYHLFSCDTARAVQNIVSFELDLERRVGILFEGSINCDAERNVVRSLDFAANAERNIRRSVDLDLDVARHVNLTVAVFVDAIRNIVARLNLFPTDNSDYLPQDNQSAEPVIIPSQQVQFSAADTKGITSFEISFSEQQLTDQLKVTSAIPLQLLQAVKGQYLDYIYDMRVEKISRQGILYSADCFINIDDILYTPLNYDMPAITYQLIFMENQAYEKALYPLASRHVAAIANALGLEPVMQFDDFYSTVEVNAEKENGGTYADLIRNIFGWSSRVPTQLINAYIRNGKLFVIQRGHEANLIDISDADMAMLTITQELFRIFYQRQKFSRTETFEVKRRRINHVNRSSEIHDGENSASNYSYNDSGLLDHSVTSTTNSSGETVRTETDYKYRTLASGEKVLVKETTKKYVNGSLDETTETKHTPLRQGLSHQIKTDEDGDIISEGVGQNTADDRVSPYSEFRDDTDWEVVQEHLYTEGLSLIDTSFPIQNAIRENFTDSPYPILGLTEEERFSVDTAKGHGRLKAITEELKRLNRTTKETVNVTIYNFPHLIDFNDRIVLNGYQYFLVSNNAKSVPRLFNSQYLTLVRWF